MWQGSGIQGHVGYALGGMWKSQEPFLHGVQSGLHQQAGISGPLEGQTWSRARSGGFSLPHLWQSVQGPEDHAQAFGCAQGAISLSC